MIRRWMQSCIEDVLPFAAMVVVECGEVAMITLGKAAMNRGLSSLLYVVYFNAFGTIILLPFFIFHRHRSYQAPITFRLLCKFFVLGLIGICLLQISAYAGIKYSSPTLAAAIGNSIPAFTFLLAIILRMEMLDLRKSSSQGKSLGTILAISGTFVMTFYKGPPIWMTSSPDSIHQLLLSQPSNWVLGGILITFTCIFSSTWNIFQTATVKEYPDEITIVFFYCCFGTIQCAVFALFMERNPGAWVVHPGIEMIAVAFAGVFGSVFRSSVITWCLRIKGPVYVAMFKPISMVIAAISGIMFFGDILHLGSVIGAILIAVGFYTVMWGKAKEKRTEVDIICGLESSTPNSPLLQK